VGKLKQKALDLRLEEELNAVRRLRERIHELKYAIDYADQGRILYYAVDFSEIFSYLHYEEEEDRNIIGVTLDLENSEKNFLQYRLGLTHLFNSFAETLYILPSHALEMWSYARSQVKRKPLTEDQAMKLFERTRRLSPDLKMLLQREGHDSEEISRELLAFVKSPEFGPLCVDVSEFVNSYRKGNVLKNLVLRGRVSTRIDNLLIEHGIKFTELAEPFGDEVSEIFRRFPRANRNRAPFSTRVDARAFLYLRNMNRLLNSTNAQLILVTRDTHLLEIAQAVADNPSFDWSEARQCLRGIESIFLDLILTSVGSAESRHLWILESEIKLARMQEAVERTLVGVRSNNTRSQGPHFASAGKRVLKDSAQLWDQHINVKLSLSSKLFPWLEESLHEASSGEKLPDTFKGFRREYKTLTNLFEYFSTPTYRTAAVEDVKSIWNGIELDCMRMSLLKALGEEGADKLSQILAQTMITPSGEQRTIIHSKLFHKMPSLLFVSKTYRNKLSSLGTKSSEEYEGVLYSIITEVVSGFNKPEDFLMMAFLFGLLNEWQQALVVIEKCYQSIAEPTASSLPQIIPSEVDYFSSAIKRRLAQITDDPLNATKLYIEAYRDIVRARQAIPDDVRYLVAESAGANLYRELVKKLGLDAHETGIRAGLPYEILTQSDAKKQYLKALNLAKNSGDIRMSVVTLNNLAFTEVFADSPSFSEADSYIDEMDEIVKNATGEQAMLLSGILPHISETKLMLKASQARHQNNIETLKACIESLRRIMEDTDLLEYERKGFVSHIDIVKTWLAEITK